MRRVGVFLACFAVSSLMLSSPVTAHSSVAQDPAGDIAAGVPAFYDIVKAKVHATGAGDTIAFSMRVAEEIPDFSPDTDAGTFLALNWILDTTSVAGPEYNVVVRWCARGTHPQCQLGPAHWEASIRDLHTAAFTFLSPDSFAIEGNDATVSVSPALLGGASEFTWFAASRTIPAQTAPPTDVAPDNGLMSFRG